MSKVSRYFPMLVLAAGVAYGAWLAFQESGESLPRVAAATTSGPSASSDETSAPTGTDPR